MVSGFGFAGVFVCRALVGGAADEFRGGSLRCCFPLTTVWVEAAFTGQREREREREREGRCGPAFREPQPSAPNYKVGKWVEMA